MPFDSDSKDDIEYFICPGTQCGGIVTYNKEAKLWECDTCDFEFKGKK